jgi:hypothetical protein|tara:strand:- start:214 stop:495 length:282 start_codon:yes stop_codon:yes gene_type:complete
MKLYEISIHGIKVPKHIKEKMIIQTERILCERFGKIIYKNFNGERLPLGLVCLPNEVKNIDLTHLYAIKVTAKLTQLNGNYAQTTTKGGHNGK